MYQRKDKRERFPSGCHEGVLELFRLLESENPSEVESVKNVIHENLSTAKDSRLLNCIVEYYMALHSEQSLEILVRVKDPHDKHLFDKINELMKLENTRHQSLLLLSNLVYKQPSWIYKIAQHRLMNSLFNLLKNDIDAANLISALLIIVCLLPMIPSQFGAFLPEMFNVFSRLIAWNAKKPSAISETYILHLQVAVYSLFNRLYGMFPCNFLAYLRSYYGGRDYNEENFRIFTHYIKPMLERVRLHPLLVTASKETELSISRWRKMEYHDVLTDCASISLDAVEGTLEGIRGRVEESNPASKRHAHLSAQNSLQFASLSSQSSITSVEPGSVVNEALSSHRDSLWSPSHSYCSALHLVGNTVSSLVTKTNPEAKNLSSQLSEESVVLDLAVEAKPEELKEEEQHTLKQQLTKTPSKDSKSDYKSSIDESDKTTSVSTTDDFSRSAEKRYSDASSSEVFDSSLEKGILQGVEAKEEDIDKEVSELTSSGNKSTEASPGEERHDTPFCSTTQNLTDEPPDLRVCSDSTVGVRTKSQDDDVDEMYTSMQDAEEDIPPYVPPTFSRYRFVSHCGPPPIIPSEYIKKPKVMRSISCPAKFCSTSQSSSVPDTDIVSEGEPKTDVATCSNDIITTASAFVIANNVILSSSRVTYEHLIPMAMEPLPSIFQPPNSNLESNYNSYNTLFSSLSPHELLDNYMQLGSETYVTQINTIPITSTQSTDWTHFGGKPPPDEVDILRKQILLLHNQLLFERHRKDVHSERIRRILGRAKKAKMLDELVVALKEQVSLLEQNNENLDTAHSNASRMLVHVQQEKEHLETELNSLIKKIKLENNQFQFANKKLQSLLVSQKEENDKIIADSLLYQNKILDLETDLELCRHEIECCHENKAKSEFLSKKLLLLQEINNMYKEKIEGVKKPTNTNIEDDLLSAAAFAEIKDLKARLESTCVQLHATKSKLAEVEQSFSNMKLKQKEQYQIIESIKSFHKDEMKVCKDHLKDHKKIAIMKDAYILELFKEKEILTEKLKTLEKKLSGGSAGAKETCDNSSLERVQESTLFGISEHSTSDRKISHS